MTRPQPSPRAEFPHFRPVQLRWNDNDPYGHMNNAVHYQLFDSAVNDWLIDNGMLQPDLTGVAYMVAATGCDYFAELAYPERIELGMGITRLGSTSVTYRLGLFRAGTDRSAATGRFTHVHVDRNTRRPQTIPDAHRDRFATLLIAAE
ncbi:thioesterase family protein [uncultured Paracoccus sp.]|uniref:acyl-CoA thioesterase n=1 Tax=uncultured Paracoccus sp. TaxID=189685 RepID=UPI0026193A8B|nr:thioesterase family protein [uncultured Paracoccus sp.]